MEGAEVGTGVGFADGKGVGSLVGAGVGVGVGFSDGSGVGAGVGFGDGIELGAGVGVELDEGSWLGVDVGSGVGGAVSILSSRRIQCILMWRAPLELVDAAFSVIVKGKSSDTALLHTVIQTLL